VATGACLRILEHPEPIRTVVWGQANTATGASACTPVTGGASASEASYLVALGEEPSTTAWLWCESTGRCIAVLAEHKDAITDVAFSPDGRWVATVSNDSSLLLWEAASGQLRGVFMGDAGMTSCCWAEEGGALVVGDAGGQVHIMQSL
jgi:WD40 repeat protein